VQTKIQRFSGSQIVRNVVGQPRSTIDPGEWLRAGRIVIVSTARGVVGEDAAALVGATLFNLVALTVAAQAGLPSPERRAVTLLVDEFHALPGADYEAVLAELAKYGADLVLATQSLARLDALDRAHDRALTATVFANLDGLLAFHTSAEDARYLVRELGDGVDEADPVSLGEHRCYARLSVGGERLPAFSVRLDAPPEDDPDRRRELAAASAARFGRGDAAAGAADPEAVARTDHRNRPGQPSPIEPDRVATQRQLPADDAAPAPPHGPDAPDGAAAAPEREPDAPEDTP
jgi:hypothetical protein